MLTILDSSSSVTINVGENASVFYSASGRTIRPLLNAARAIRCATFKVKGNGTNGDLDFTN